MEYRNHRLWQAAACVVCAAVNCRYGSDLWGTEFSGGWVTGRLLDLKLVGDLLLLLALPLTFVYRRIAAAIILLASPLCLPLYLYSTAPGPFRWVVGGEWKGLFICAAIACASAEAGNLVKV